MSQPARAVIDLDALRSNYDFACSLAPGSATMAVIKANAYGHGAVQCARALEDRVPAFAVCGIEEAMELRESGIRKPILLLQGRVTAEEIRLASEQEFWLAVYRPAQVSRVVGQKLARPVVVWVRVDTGMHRLGMSPADLKGAFERLGASANVGAVPVVATHFASADDLDDDFTQRQIERFRAAAGDMDAPLSMANSAGLMAWPESRADWNRPGIMLYGSSPMGAPHPADRQLRPVMHLQSEVIALREVAEGESVGYTRNWKARQPATIATVAIGYGDGYPRHAPNGTPVLVNGRRAPLAGRVSMDMITVDVSGLDRVGIGDPVTLWGAGLDVNEVAASAGTIGYELLTRMTGRVALEYR